MTDKQVAKTKRVTTKEAKPAAAKITAVKKPAAKKVAVTEPKKTKAPAVKKVASTATGEKAPVKKTASAKAKPAAAEKNKAKITPEERYRMVETTAYFIAERHGFQGDSTEHWMAAEIEIAAKLGQ